jgi:hypothetical protein
VASLNADSNPGNNQATFAGFVSEKADLLVIHEPVTPQFVLSNEVSLSVLVTNRGTVPSPRTGLLVAFSLNVELVSAELFPETATGEVAPPGVVCNLGAMPPGAFARLTVRVRPTHTGRFVSQATLFSPAVDPGDPATSNRLERDILSSPALLAEQAGNRLYISWPAVADNFVLESRILAPARMAAGAQRTGARGRSPGRRLKPSSAQRFFRVRRADGH